LLKSFFTNIYRNTDRNTEQEFIRIIDDLCDVYILIDGLDEAENVVFSSPSKTTGMFETATADKIIKNIFEGRFLINAKKIITSRPDAYLSLHPKCKPDFTVQFLGLSKKSQIELSKHICKNNDETYTKVQENWK